MKETQGMPKALYEALRVLIEQIPTSCATPLKVCDDLAGWLSAANADAATVPIPLRELRWLIEDARTLNRLISRVYFDGQEGSAARDAGTPEPRASSRSQASNER
jgi:hypothetical protein